MLNFNIYNLVTNVNAMVFGSNKFRIRRSHSKASYLAYRRERGAPDSEGSYKRTMSPTARLEDWPPPRDRDDPVLLRVTPHQTFHHHHHHHHHHHQQQQQQRQQQQQQQLQPAELSKSQSVDALHHRLDERPTSQHSVEVISKLSHELTKKLQASEIRPQTNNNNINNNNNDNLEDRHHHHHHHHSTLSREKSRHEKERLSPQSVEVLNDRNRQLERERRKLAANCEPIQQIHSSMDNLSLKCELYRDESNNEIEMTSQNIELLNRRNEKRSTGTSCDSWLNSKNYDAELKPPPPPTNSPPHSPSETLNHKNHNHSGAIPRRSGSSSSSSSSGKSDLRLSPSTSLPSRASKSVLESRKVSSPTQTEENWAKICLEGDDSSSARRSSISSSRSRGRSSLSSVSSSSKSSSSSQSSSSSSRDSPVESNNKSGTTSPCVSPQPGIEGLTLVQRTEVILRVNAATSDASSQTELLEDDNNDNDGDHGKVIEEQVPEPRRKLPEEIECEELSRDLASQLSPNDKLLPILVPVPEHKKPTDYVTGLFKVEATLQPRPRRRLSLEDSIESNSDFDKKHDSIPSTPVTPISIESTSPLSPTSAYFTTSEGKARFLTRYSRDVSVDETIGSENSTPVLSTDNADLKQKKEELMIRLDKKLVVLRAEQEAVREEGEINEALGARVATRVSAVARPAEASKYRLHVEEVGKITSLLLGLSGRLARAENALYGMPPDHAERKILESKRDKLMDQLEEAKILKSNIDKRSVSVSAILAKYLNDEEYADYQHFINMKAKLIMDGREILDKVKLGEEQLAALKEAID